MPGSTVANYTDRITRILPTEFIAAYLAVTQIAQDDLALRQPLLIVCLLVCLLLIPMFLTRIKGITDRRHHFVVTMSFLVWAYALGDVFQPGLWIPYDLYHPRVGAALMVVWGLVPLVLDIDAGSGGGNDS